MGEQRESNFSPRILSPKKFRSQESYEDETKFICSNGIVMVSRVESLNRWDDVFFYKNFKL